MKPAILILCTGNCARSQMAEGLLRAAGGDILEVHSAGSHPAGFVHPLAVEAMDEIGIDIRAQRSKSLNEFLNRPIETVITVCGNVDQICPVFPGQAQRLHWGFEDPSHAIGTREDRLDAFRKVRDQLKEKFEAYAAERRKQATSA